MKIKVEIEDQKDVWGVSVNRDLNEGRGPNWISKLCEKESTAIRLSKKADVQGSDGSVVKLEAYKIYGKWFYFGAEIIQPTEGDRHMEEQLIRKRVADKARAKALKKAKELGLSDAEIALLK